jgi:glucokinase
VPTFSFPVLIGDIGGTNARFALLRDGGEPAHLAHLPRVLTAAYPGPVLALRAALAAGAAEPPRSALLAVAAPIEGPVVPLTNAPWVIDAAAIAAGLGLDRVVLVNDFVPAAAALADLGGDADPRLQRIGPACAPAAGTKVVLGPGTGLGAAALVPAGGRLAVVSTEAGHMEFGPADAGEEALWRGIERLEGRVAAEQILSGPGLTRLYRAVAALEGGDGRRLDSAAAIVDAALAGTDPLSRRTLDLFAGLLGRFAGDLALAFGAIGGVTLAGSVTCRIAPVLAAGRFRASFESKAPHVAYMRRIPTSLLRNPDPAIPGLAAIAAAPDRFAFASQAVER